MEFEIVRKLANDPIFYYERKTGTLSFDGTYREYLCTEQTQENFFANCQETKLIESRYVDLLKEKWEANLEDEEEVYMELQMLTPTQKYETFRIKGIYLEERDALLGVVRNIEIERRAVTDPLTGLLNREGIMKNINEVLESASSENWIALYLIDLDNFKEVNDTRGHLLGDELLKEVACVLQESFCEDAYVGRVGGDEFVVLSYGEKETAQIARRAQLVCDILAERFAENNYGVTLSVGIAVAQRKISGPILYTQADAALYATKCAGKNGYTFYSPELKDTRYSNDRRKGGSKGSALQDDAFSQYHKLISNAVDVINKKLSTKDTIEEITALVVQEFGVTRAYASCYMPDGSRLGKSYFSAQNDDPNIKPSLGIKRDEYVKNYNADGVFFCTDVTKVNEPLRSELIRMQVESLLQLLVYDLDGNVIGTVGINNCGKKRLWVQDEIDVMQTITKILTRTIQKLQDECVEEGM